MPGYPRATAPYALPDPGTVVLDYHGVRVADPITPALLDAVGRLAEVRVVEALADDDSEDALRLIGLSRAYGEAHLLTNAGHLRHPARTEMGLIFGRSVAPEDLKRLRKILPLKGWPALVAEAEAAVAEVAA